MIQQLQAGGLTLKECEVCLKARIDPKLLQDRLKTLDQEIEQKQRSRKLLAAVLGEGDFKTRHAGLNVLAADAHLDRLIKQDFSEKEALQLKWLSKDMNEHDLYMADFMKVYQTLEYWGPGSERDTRKALSLVPNEVNNILDIGCGKGLATMVLAEISEAQITAVDNEQSALDRLAHRFEKEGMSSRLGIVKASMTELPFREESFDLIWSEGSAYIMGVENALTQWKRHIRKNGYLVISDMVWRTDNASKESIELWNQDYPDIKSVQIRLEQMENAGYKIIGHFPMSEEAWWNYYEPLQKRVMEFESEIPSSAAIKDIKQEVSVCTQFAHEFGYHMFILANS